VPDFNINVRIDPSHAVRGTRRTKRALKTVDVAADRVRRSIGAAFAFAGLSLGVAQLIRYADTLQNVQNRLRIVTTSTEQLEAVNGALFRTANETRQSYEATAELYNRVALAGKNLNVTHQQVLDLTKSVSQAIVISGASGTEAQAGLIQFAQGLASGTLRGDELRSVLEQLPAVADVLADHFETDRAGLRKLGEQGLITSRDIIEAFEEAGDSLDEKFAKTIPTVSQATTVLRNNFLQLFGVFDRGTQASQSLAKFILTIAESLDELVLSTATAIDAFLQLKNSQKDAKAAVRESRQDPNKIPGYLQPFEYLRTGVGPSYQALREGEDLGTAFRVGLVKSLGGGEAAVERVIQKTTQSEFLDQVIEALAKFKSTRSDLLNELVGGGSGFAGGGDPVAGQVDFGVEAAPGGVGNVYAQQAAALAEVNVQLDRERYLLGLTSGEAAVQSRLFETIDGLRAAGIELLPGEQERIETLIRQNEELRNQTEEYTRLGGAIVQLEEEVGSAAKIVDNLAVGSVGVLASEFTNAVVSGRGLTELFQDLGAGISRVTQQIADMILQLYLLKGLSRLGLPVSLPGAPVTRQGGGPLRAGQTAIVGENGPELFRPNTAGTVVPNDQAFGGGRVSLKVVNLTDPREARREIDSGDNDEAFLNLLSRNSRTARGILSMEG
jgi:tape measure domain-containing protein